MRAAPATSLAWAGDSSPASGVGRLALSPGFLPGTEPPQTDGKANVQVCLLSQLYVAVEEGRQRALTNRVSPTLREEQLGDEEHGGQA